jgi:hypothetical protein
VAAIPSPAMEVIDTNDPEREVWERVGYFESESYTNNFRNAKISDATLALRYSFLVSNKQTHNSVRSNPQLEILPKVSAINILVGREIALNARQARDFYATARTMPMISKPIILHYAFEKLANIAILSTFEVTGSTYAHGLGFNPTTLNVTVEKKGLFSRLHDCYSTNPTIYASNYEFKIDSLISNNPIDESELLQIGTMFDGMAVHEETTNSDVQMGEADREFLFMFALSSLARYHVNTWSDIIEGRNDTRILSIRRYTQSVQRFFPNWILNALHWKNLSFFTVGRAG